MLNFHMVFTMYSISHCILLHAVTSLHHIVFYLGFRAVVSALVCLIILHICFFCHVRSYLFLG